VKRLHDLDRSGAHYWLLLVPLYNIYLALLLLFKKGTTGPNRFGPDPLQSALEQEVAAGLRPPEVLEAEASEAEAPSGEVVASSTPEIPTPRDLYRKLLSELPPDSGQVATFQAGVGGDGEQWVQVTRGEGACINMGYPFDEEPSQMLRSKGVPLPEGTVLSAFEIQTSATFEIPTIYVEGLVDCVEAIFTRVLGVPADSQMSGWIE
jgi:hypothetical protein